MEKEVRSSREGKKHEQENSKARGFVSPSTELSAALPRRAGLCWPEANPYRMAERQAAGASFASPLQQTKENKLWSQDSRDLAL